MQYKSPNVYIKEESNLPPSVAQTSSAIPTFIGYTEAGYKDKPKAVLINTFLDFTKQFGGADPSKFEVEYGQAPENQAFFVKNIKVTPSKFSLYYSIRHYFDNGGGRCYIVSVGTYSANANGPQKDQILAGLDALKAEDEPTLIVCPEAVKLDSTDCKTYIEAALAQCAKMENRFVIFDVKQEAEGFENSINDFRSNASSEYLKYGAAYYPYLQTTLSHVYNEKDVKVKDFSEEIVYGAVIDLGSPKQLKITSSAKQDPKLTIKIVSDSTVAAGTVKIAKGEDTLTITYNDTVTAAAFKGEWSKSISDKELKLELINLTDSEAITLPAKEVKLTAISNAVTGVNTISYGAVIDLGSPKQLKITSSAKQDPKLTIKIVSDSTVAAGTVKIAKGKNTLTITYNDTVTAAALKGEWSKSISDKELKLELINLTDSETITLPAKEVKLTVISNAGRGTETTLDNLKKTQLELYNQIIASLQSQYVILPPSAAMAGIYVRVDRDRGVWKAPANVSVNSVIGPMVRLTNEQQDFLNDHPETGKSINAIRSFTGKGTLVWGARTLDGSSNEWRYIPVRRLFNVIESSVKKATSFAVFEPNVAITWLKVRTMIESYLNNLWRQGALAGGTPEQAFFVKVGLGSTMTKEEINQGLMIVKIGVAAVRPAEFIILTFSHKMQEA